MPDTTDEQIMKDHPNEFEQGQRMRLSSANPEEPAFEKGTPQRRAYDLGFEAAEGEAARNKTSGPVDQQDNHDDDGEDKPAAVNTVGQTETMHDLNTKD